MTIESIFRFYTNEAKPYMTLFESKCAIVRGLGAELPMRQIIDILELECNWKKTDRYLALENFGKLYNIVELAEKKNKPRSHYEKFDLRRRGWIVEDDVYRVVSLVAPRFAYKHVDDIFSHADVNNVGQVSQRHYETTLSELRTQQQSAL